MKKLGKLNLKKEKMLSQEELVSFRGGSGSNCEYNELWCGCAYYHCTCPSGGGSFTNIMCCSEELINISGQVCTQGGVAQCWC